jgi:dihydroneopterin aldolase
MSEEHSLRLDRDHQRVILQDVDLKIRCGLHPWEKHPERPNRVLISVELYSRAAFDPASRSEYIDYDRIYDHLLGYEGRDHVLLLETLLDDLVRFIFEDPLVDACRVKAIKPEIFNRARGAGVEWFRLRSP